MCTRPIFVDGVLRDCGKCIECRKRRTAEIAIRLYFESMYHEKSSFWTFTYDDEHLPLSQISNIPTLKKEDFKLFMKRLRKTMSDYGKIRVFYCGEYGGQTDRPHYHAILFGISEDMHDIVTRIWQKGFTTSAPLNFIRCRYVAKYMLKNEHYNKDFCYNHGIEPQFIQSSNRPGIGYQYVYDNAFNLSRNFFIRYKGIKFSMPRYFYKKMREFDEYFDYKLHLNGFNNFMRKVLSNRYFFDYKSFEALSLLLKQRDLNLNAMYNLKGI